MLCSDSLPSKRLQNTAYSFGSLHLIVCYVFATREKSRDRYQALLSPSMQKKKICLYKYNTDADWLEPAYLNELIILFSGDICQGRSEVRKCS